MSTGVDWDKELERRIGLTTSRDTVRGMLLKGHLEAVRGLAGDEAARQCELAAGGGPFTEFFGYPVQSHLRLVQAAIRVVGPRFESPEEVLRRLGRDAVRVFMASPVGAATRMLTGNSARLLMNSVPRAFAVALSFGERKVEWTDAKRGCLKLRREFMPAVLQEALVLALLEGVEAEGAWARGSQVGDLEVDVEFGWGAGRLR
jgi:uncharacterized protein (TIGR02265 family)